MSLSEAAGDLQIARRIPQVSTALALLLELGLITRSRWKALEHLDDRGLGPCNPAALTTWKLVADGMKSSCPDEDTELDLGEIRPDKHLISNWSLLEKALRNTLHKRRK